MKRRDSFSAAFDGLPLLSDQQIGGMGLFLLRISYLLISAMPLVLSGLDAIMGVASRFLYVFGLLALALPLVLDVLRRISSRSLSFDSLIVLGACALLIWEQFYAFAVVLLFSYHLFDLFSCILLRESRKKLFSHLSFLTPERGSPVRRGARGETIHASEGEMLYVDCRVLHGNAVCTLGDWDSHCGDFDVSSGDTVFAGTKVLDGALELLVISEEKKAMPYVVSRKMKRCLSTESSHARACNAFCIPLQTIYLLLLLMAVTMFVDLFRITLLAFSCLFCCIGVFARILRALEFYLLDRLTALGIYPESMSAVYRLPTMFEKAGFLDGKHLNPRTGCNASRIFKVSSRLPRKRPVVLEYAVEFSALIARSDFALLYRSKDVLQSQILFVRESIFLLKMIELLTLIVTSIAVLVLALSDSVVVFCVILLFLIVFMCFSVWLSFTPRMRKNL